MADLRTTGPPEKFRPGIRLEDLEDIFVYHPPTTEQREAYLAIRSGAKEFARILLENTPRSGDQTTAIRWLRESVHMANAAVALEGKF